MLTAAPDGRVTGCARPLSRRLTRTGYPVRINCTNDHLAASRSLGDYPIHSAVVGTAGNQQLRYELSNIRIGFSSEDAQEARKAFFEKRQPVFKQDKAQRR